MADPQTASAWYDLIHRLYTDLRGATFQKQKARLSNYHDLFVQLRKIHKDYVEMFAKLKYGLLVSDASGIEVFKSDFMEERRRGGPERAITLVDAEALVHSGLPEDESAFLKSAHDYLIVRDSPFGGMGSMSGLFWSRIEHETDPEILTRDCDKALESISNTYQRLVATYSKLDPAFRLSGVKKTERDTS